MEVLRRVCLSFKDMAMEDRDVTLAAVEVDDHDEDDDDDEESDEEGEDAKIWVYPCHFSLQYAWVKSYK